MKPHREPERLLTTNEAAALSPVSAPTLRRYTNAGLVPCLRLPSGERRFRRVDIEAAFPAEYR